MSGFRPRLTYANIVSTLCLFVLLGGGAYAATRLGKNSVGTRQIKNGAVTEKKISAKAIAALKSAKGDKGEKGERGATGPAGPSTSGFVNSGEEFEKLEIPHEFMQGNYFVLDTREGGHDVTVTTDSTIVVSGTAVFTAPSFINPTDTTPVYCQAYVRNLKAAAPKDIPVGMESQTFILSAETQTEPVTGYATVPPGDWALRLGCFDPAATGILFERGTLTGVATGP